MPRVLVVALALALTAGACASDDPAAEDSFVTDINDAIAAVEADRGAGQEYFEVTATSQFTNVFVATNDGTAAVPYVYRNGVLEPPAPVLEGASGFTFTADSVDFDEDAIVSQVAEELPDASIDTLSVEGGDGGTVRYVVSARSSSGGVLDVTVGPDGVVLAVDPI